MPVEQKEDHDKSTESADEECTAAFPPVVTLPIVEVKTHEEEEEVLLALRAKLYRYCYDPQEPEWKERGTGELKVLKHADNKTVRIVMRRDKTLKVCANHFIKANYELRPMKGSEKAFIYVAHADFSDEVPKSTCFAVRFVNAECANKFREVFNESKAYVQDSDVNEEEKDLSFKMVDLNLSNSNILPTNKEKK